ncbi:MAG: hypothetical protein N4J56_007435 [Chroococcidiopsis sp. SAG 2025]|uniref:DUF4278 domain-containing protein n=1 Tax=Chroococcidiopsis sp. SAG 2025 TaxID=171389 RepID=UPI002936E8CC|nr:DUF4278 domain-containing protein [Chroococcidiopsis sp. SAG 2025]MDV2997730.1 hypothetical protein [Chroococcidiopsis sp. SAG 2025]
MKLIYRGVTYECHPSETSKHPFQKVRSLLTTEIPGSLAVHQLIYRGVTHVRAHRTQITFATQPTILKRSGAARFWVAL